MNGFYAFDTKPETEIIDDIMGTADNNLGKSYSRCLGAFHKILDVTGGGLEGEIYRLFAAAKRWYDLADKEHVTLGDLEEAGISLDAEKLEARYEFDVSDAYKDLCDDCCPMETNTAPDDDGPFILTDKDGSGLCKLIGKVLVDPGDDGWDTRRNTALACYDNLVSMHFGGLCAGSEDGRAGVWVCNELAELWMLFACWVECREKASGIKAAGKLIEERHITRLGEYCETIGRDSQALAELADSEFVTALKDKLSQMRDKYADAFVEAAGLYTEVVESDDDPDGLRNGSMFQRWLEENRPELAEWMENGEFSEELGVYLKAMLIQRWENVPASEILDEIEATCAGEIPCSGRADVIANVEWLDRYAAYARPDWVLCLADEENRKEVERFIDAIAKELGV